jgi:hypothetical protein
MRISFYCVLCCTLLLLSTVGIAFSQDTNFPTGPQYLINSDPTSHASPLFARPISTPSLSLNGPPLEVGADDATGVLTAGADDRTISPPLAVALPTVDLLPLYSGAPQANVVEISFGASEASPSLLPASFLETGVWQVTTPQALRQRGYGVTLADAAAHAKATRRTTRVYTNADIDRLRGSS